MAATTRIISDYITVGPIVKIINDLLCPENASPLQVGESGHCERCLAFGNDEVLEGTWRGRHQEITKRLMLIIRPIVIDWYITHECIHDINKLKWFIPHVPTARLDLILRHLCSVPAMSADVIKCVSQRCSVNGLTVAMQAIGHSNRHDKNNIINIIRASLNLRR